MALVYLIRHGQSTWNAERRWAGHANPPLSAAGREETYVACEALAHMNFDGVVSSSLARARETAEIIAHQLNLPLHQPLPDFNERHAGLVSGLTSSEIEVKFPEFLSEWRQGNINEIPGGESWEVFVKRVIQGLVRFKNFGTQRVLLVTHEGVLRAVAQHLNEPQCKHENLQGKWLELGLILSDADTDNLTSKP